jgi:hypothetical protein
MQGDEVSRKEYRQINVQQEQVTTLKMHGISTMDSATSIQHEFHLSLTNNLIAQILRSII